MLAKVDYGAMVLLGYEAAVINKDPKTCPSRIKAMAWLEKGGVRPTRQRLSLAALLVGDGEDRHVTAEALYEAARLQAVPVSLATVYNTLRCFSDAGLVNEVRIDGQKSFFDTCTHAHAHYYWEETGALSDAPMEVAPLPSELSAPEGASISRVDLVIRLRAEKPARKRLPSSAR